MTTAAEAAPASFRQGHLRALDLYGRALFGHYPAGIERRTPAGARLIQRGLAATAIDKCRVARERAAQLRGLPIGDDCARWASRELQQLRNARREHSYYVEVSRRLAVSAEPMPLAAE